MHSIKGLIVKDYLTLKSYKSTILFMFIILIGGGILNDGITTFLPIFLPLFFEMLAISSFSYDNLAKSDKYLLTFPINKKQMVKARYIYILLFTLLGSLMGLIFSMLFQIISLKGVINLEVLENNLATVIGSFVGIMFLQSIQIPMMYKFGAEKGRIMQLIMIVAVMIGVSLITTFLLKVLQIPLDSFVVMLKNYLIAIIGIVVIMMYFFSYVISCKLYGKKEY